MNRILTGLVVVLISGCATAPLKSTLFEDVSNMTPQHDMDRFRVSSGLDLKHYDTLVIAPIITKGMIKGPDLTDEDEQALIGKLEENFRIQLARYFKSVIGEQETTPAENALKLEVALTELTPTDVAANLMWGFGVGNATAGIEGRFVDAKSGKELIAFADRKKGSPFTKKEYNAGIKFPNWSKTRYLYLFTEIWAENVGNIVKSLK